MTITGTFVDGVSARRRSVRVVLGPSTLCIHDVDDDVFLAEWPYNGLRRLDSRTGLRIAPTGEEGPRLDLDGDSAAKLIARTGALRGMHAHFRWRTSLAVVAAAMALLVGSYSALPLVAEPIARSMPDDWHRKFGDFAARALQGSRPTCQGDGLPALERLADRLLPPGERRHPLRLRVINDESVNAFSTGGGHVAVLRGLIDKAESPDEVAGVLAHELAHEKLGHVSRRMVQHMGLAALVSIATGDSSGSLAGVASALIESSYSRQDETAADDAAVLLLVEAGIGTDGLARFFERLETESPSGDSALALLASNPQSAERARRIVRQDGTAALTATEWAAVKAICK